MITHPTDITPVFDIRTPDLKIARDAFVDVIARIRSGAALSPDAGKLIASANGVIRSVSTDLRVRTGHARVLEQEARLIEARGAVPKAKGQIETGKKKAA